MNEEKRRSSGQGVSAQKIEMGSRVVEQREKNEGKRRERGVIGGVRGGLVWCRARVEAGYDFLVREGRMRDKKKRE